MDYNYPLDYETYNTQEILVMIDFLSYLEESHKHYDYKTLKDKYLKYKTKDDLSNLSNIKSKLYRHSLYKEYIRRLELIRWNDSNLIPVLDRYI